MTTLGKVIDTHLHVWSSTSERSAFPIEQAPTDSLSDKASVSELLQQMKEHSVDGALIVQPINHKFDHSYVTQAIKEHPARFKGMLLNDPSLSAFDAVQRLEELALKGFVGVRFNPYLWPKASGGKDEESQAWEKMSQGAGLEVYKRCGELKMPVGIMCFQGLELHYDDILSLLNESPHTSMILDHFGFTAFGKEESFRKLLALSKYPQVYVKLSALFRLNDVSPFDKVRDERFLPLLKAYGADRLMYGSDFPFVLEEDKGYGMVDLVRSWVDDENDRRAILGGTAERLFGAWA